MCGRFRAATRWGSGLLEKADRFNAAEARVRMVCSECQRVRQFYLASMAEARAWDDRMARPTGKLAI
jgi:hypothetical protein